MGERDAIFHALLSMDTVRRHLPRFVKHGDNVNYPTAKAGGFRFRRTRLA